MWVSQRKMDAAFDKLTRRIDVWSEFQMKIDARVNKLEVGIDSLSKSIENLNTRVTDHDGDIDELCELNDAQIGINAELLERSTPERAGNNVKTSTSPGISAQVIEGVRSSMLGIGVYRFGVRVVYQPDNTPLWYGMVIPRPRTCRELSKTGERLVWVCADNGRVYGCLPKNLIRDVL